MVNLKDVEIFYYDRIGGMSPQQGESPQRYLKFEDVEELLKSTHNKQSTPCKHDGKSHLNYMQTDLVCSKCGAEMNVDV